MSKPKKYPRFVLSPELSAGDNELACDDIDTVLRYVNAWLIQNRTRIGQSFKITVEGFTKKEIDNFCEI